MGKMEMPHARRVDFVVITEVGQSFRAWAGLAKAQFGEARVRQAPDIRILFIYYYSLYIKLQDI